jgi:hypothetical protein
VALAEGCRDQADEEVAALTQLKRKHTGHSGQRVSKQERQWQQCCALLLVGWRQRGCLFAPVLCLSDCQQAATPRPVLYP